eukprot:6487270-Amphidinium_carterae.1
MLEKPTTTTAKQYGKVGDGQRKGGPQVVRPPPPPLPSKGSRPAKHEIAKQKLHPHSHPKNPHKK